MEPKLQNRAFLRTSILPVITTAVLFTNSWLNAAEPDAPNRPAPVRKTVIETLPEKANFSVLPLLGKLYLFKYGPDYDTARPEDYAQAGAVYAFDPATGKWETKRPMPVKKLTYRLVPVGDRVFVIGGYVGPETPTTSIEEYDPANDTWAIRRAMPTARCRVGTAVLDGKIYAVGGLAKGEESDAVEVYDPAKDEWTVKNSLFRPLMGVQLLAVSNRLFMLRGVDVTNGQWRFIYDFREYEPGADVWTKRAAWTFEPEPEEVLALDGRFFVLGGGAFRPSTRSLKEYDLSSDQWVLRSDMPAASQRTVHFSLTALGGKIYTFGGGMRQNNRWQWSNRAQRYDPATDTWEALEPLSEGKIGMAVTALGDKVFVFGGEISEDSANSTKVFSNKIEIYEVVGK